MSDKTTPKRFRVERDFRDIPVAISCDNYYVLHLAPGTVRNRLNVDKIVEILNSVNTDYVPILEPDP